MAARAALTSGGHISERIDADEHLEDLKRRAPEEERFLRGAGDLVRCDIDLVIARLH